MPVWQMLRSMSSHELSEWQAFYIMEAEAEKRRANQKPGRRDPTELISAMKGLSERRQQQ